MRRLRTWLALLAVLGLTACGATKTVTHTTPPSAPVEAQPTIPPKPGGVPSPAHEGPGCDAEEQQAIEAGKGEAGMCAPRSALFSLSAPTVSRGSSGPDVSNNDPISNWHPIHAHGHRFAYVKVIQGTRFVDSTASDMVRAQRSAGIIPGGYDFLEVCRVGASGEARLYAARLKAIGLVGHAFVPMGDAEWPLEVPCSAKEARAWLTVWQSTLHALIHRWAGFYTGAWWWNPNVGCWRPPHGALRWVSGYIVRRLLPIPCGWHGVDLWQYTDHGFNGVSHTDMSVLEVPQSRFTGVSERTPGQKREAAKKTLDRLSKERATLHTNIDRHRCRKGQHVVPYNPPSTRHHLHNELCPRWIKRGEVIIPVIKRLERELRVRT